MDNNATLRALNDNPVPGHSINYRALLQNLMGSQTKFNPMNPQMGQFSGVVRQLSPGANDSDMGMHNLTQQWQQAEALMKQRQQEQVRMQLQLLQGGLPSNVEGGTSGTGGGLPNKPLKDLE